MRYLPRSVDVAVRAERNKIMGAPAKSYHAQRQDKCLHLLEKIDPAKNEGFRYRCIKPDCGRFLKRKIGVEPLPGPTTKQREE